jgi:hypothetical protein
MKTLNLNDNRKCASQHKFNGRTPVENNSIADGASCDCGKLIIKYHTCKCGSKKKFKFEENPNYKPLNV